MSFPISTIGIIDKLVKITIIHWVKFNIVKLKIFAKNGTKYTIKINISKIIKLRLKLLLFNMLILNRLFSVLQLAAWIICIKQMVKKDIVVAMESE